jgi:hypothetical protein
MGKRVFAPLVATSATGELERADAGAATVLSTHSVAVVTHTAPPEE